MSSNLNREKCSNNPKYSALIAVLEGRNDRCLGVRQPRTVPLAAYVTMLVATNGGWIIGTLLYHWLWMT